MRPARVDDQVALRQEPVRDRESPDRAGRRDCRAGRSSSRFMPFASELLERRAEFAVGRLGEIAELDVAGFACRS